jgi:heme/copper-type cytochrome/quinol oxidase subunit 2
MKGLLPEFNTFKLILEQGATLSLPEAIGKLVAHATTAGILELCKGGTAKGGNNVFFANAENHDDMRETHQQPELPHSRNQDCRKWKAGICAYGDDCLYQHNGKGGTVPNPIRRSEAPPKAHGLRPRAPKAPTKPTDKPADAPSCHFCLEAHDTKICPAISNTEVNYTYLLGDTSPPTIEKVEDSCISTTLKMLSGFFLLIFFVFPGSLLRAIAGIFDSDAHNTRLAILLTIIAALSYQVLAVPDINGAAHITEASYINNEIGNDANISNFLNYEWCIDPGTNRFVTNDIDDLLPASIVHVDTVVAVGSGNATSNLHGTVIVRAASGKTIACTNVLYMPACGKKLMPASPFIRRGCKLSFYDSNKVRLSSSEDDIIFEGKEIDGLYYFESKTATTNFKKNDSAHSDISDTFKGDSSKYNFASFGLPVGKKISETANDFHLRLLEVHQAYGHLHFDKLRKLLGLKAKTGENPH